MQADQVVYFVAGRYHNAHIRVRNQQKIQWFESLHGSALFTKRFFPEQ